MNQPELIAALKAVHARNCDSEDCRGCVTCYRLTGETVCDRTCVHATEDSFTEREQDAATRVAECEVCGDACEVPADMQGWVCDPCEAKGVGQDESWGRL